MAWLVVTGGAVGRVTSIGAGTGTGVDEAVGDPDDADVVGG